MLAGTMLTSVLTAGTMAVVTGTLADRLGPNRFGDYMLARRMVGLVFPFCTLAMCVAVPRYVAMAQNDSERRAFLLGGFVLGIIPVLLIGVLSTALHNTAERLLFGREQGHGLVAGALVLLIGNSCCELLYGFYRGQGRMGRANALALAVFALGPAAVVFGPGRPTETGQILLCMGLVGCATLGTLLQSVLGGLRDGVALRLLPDALGDLWRYGWPRVPSDIAWLSILALGPWIASYRGWMADAGFLLAGQAFFLIVDVAIKSFGIVMLPRVAALHAERQVEYLRERVSDVLDFVGHVGLYATLHLLVWTRVLISVWLGVAYADAVLLARLLLVAVIPYTAYVMLRSIIDAVDSRPVNAINLGIALLGVSLASLLALIFGWGSAGLALSMSLGFWLLGALSVRYLRRHFGLIDYRFMPVRLAMVNAVLFLPSLGMAGFLQAHWEGVTLLTFGALVEGMLLLAYCTVLWGLRVRWILEVTKRIFAAAGTSATQ